MGAAHPDPFAELDALRTERNTAVAEAKLWLRKMLAMQKERDQAKRNYYECNKCLEEWMAAYYELRREHWRLEIKFSDALSDIDRNADFTDTHLWPLAMAHLQHLIEKAPE